MFERIDVLGTLFHNITKAEAVETALTLMQERKAAYFATPNPEIVMICRGDEEAKIAVNGADLVVPDGIGIIYGGKILGTRFREKVPGFELTSELLARMAERGMSAYLFGAKPGVAEKAAENMTKTWPGLKIVGVSDGYFTDDEPIIANINSCAPDLLIVCLGAPKQEKWMARNKDRLNVGLMIGNGGALDVFAGEAQRAPQKICDMGLEWAYRLYKQPSRIGRMMNLPKFMICVISRKLKGQR